MSRNITYSDTMYRNERREKIIALNKARREQQLRNRTITVVILLTFVLVGILSITLGSILSQAKTYSDRKAVKCFSSVMIGYGETVESLINDYYDEDYYSSVSSFKQEVMDINSIDEYSNITPGNYIILPYYTEL